MNFEHALHALRAGTMVTRPQWTFYVQLVRMSGVFPLTPPVYFPASNDIRTNPQRVYTNFDLLVKLDAGHGNVTPWTPTTEDILATDWEYIREARL